MKNTIKNTAYVIAGAWLLALNSATNAIEIKKTRPTTEWDNGQSNDFIGTLDTMLGYIIGLLYFIAIVFALYGWFQILTAAWDEEKVKKGKTTLINATIWLIVIFLASIIINWVISLMTGTVWTTT